MKYFNYSIRKWAVLILFALFGVAFGVMVGEGMALNQCANIAFKFLNLNGVVIDKTMINEFLSKAGYWKWL